MSIAVVEGLGIQRALDPDGFDHEGAWRAWREVVGRYLALPRGVSRLPAAAATTASATAGEAAAAADEPPRTAADEGGVAATTAALTPPVNDDTAPETPPKDAACAGVVNQNTR